MIIGMLVIFGAVACEVCPADAFCGWSVSLKMVVRMDVKGLLRSLVFFLLAAAYLFVVFGSGFGLFVDELSLFGYTLGGLPKNLLCLFGLMCAGLVPAFPLLLGVYRALNGQGK